MAQIFGDVTRQLREDQRHISNSIDRVSKSTDILVRMQQHIRASVALSSRCSRSPKDCQARHPVHEGKCTSGVLERSDGAARL
jgi:hypothetical protein